MFYSAPMRSSLVMARPPVAFSPRTHTHHLRSRNTPCFRPLSILAILPTWTALVSLSSSVPRNFIAVVVHLNTHCCCPILCPAPPRRRGMPPMSLRMARRHRTAKKCNAKIAESRAALRCVPSAASSIARRRTLSVFGTAARASGMRKNPSDVVYGQCEVCVCSALRETVQLQSYAMSP